MTTTRAYGWKRSLPDIRDHQHNFSGARVAQSVDLRTSGCLPDVWDQGQLGSCTAHGSSAAYSFDLAKQNVEHNFTPSRLFVYYNTRVIEGTVSSDSGASIADSIKSLNRAGAPPESDWGYDISKFAVAPPASAVADGKLRQAVKYAKVAGTAQDMKACLTAGLPIVIGFTVYSSFESSAVAQTGDVPMPARSEQVIGGHCVVVVGYNVRNGKNVWICRNSWGTSWGDNGYFYFPEAYLTDPNLADDFWTVQQVSSPDPTPVPPSPQPTPAPPADVDQALWAAVRDWAHARHLGATKTAAKAVLLWAKAKNFN